MLNYTVGVTKCKWLKNREVITARKRSLRRLCFHRCLSVHGRGDGGLGPGGLWLGGLCPGRAVSVQGGLCAGGSVQGVSVQRRSLSRGVSVWETPLEGGTHPTGMHSSSEEISLQRVWT